MADRWETCCHRFHSWFGPVLKCGLCGATTMVSMDPKESKQIFPPDTDATLESRTKP